jgi:hypothetical protein
MTAAYNAWGVVNGAAVGMPLVSTTPTDPVNQGYMMAWDTVNQAIGWFPINVNFTSGDVTSAGNIGVAAAKGFYVDAIQVVGAQIAGYAPMTGTPDKASVFDVAAVTLPQLAARVASLQASLTTHGLLGA